MTAPLTVADLLVQRLQENGVRTIFGYPGGQLTPIYDALYRQGTLRHILARDEQAAAFMADGFARASGQPGVCLAVCGPGVFNAATALATSFTDSIPVLCLSGQVPRPGLRSGFYHENEQLTVCKTLTKSRYQLKDQRTVTADLDQAMMDLRLGRPGPVLVEIPLDVLRREVISAASSSATLPALPMPPAPKAKDIQALADLLASWQRPLLLVGGGTLNGQAASLLPALATRLGAPVLHTLMGKSAFPADHPLAAGLTWHQATSDVTNMKEYLSPLFKQADGVLAIGCRFTQASTGSWQLKLPALAQIDIDPAEIGRHYPVRQGLVADASQAIESLLHALPDKPRTPWARLPVPRPPWRLPGLDLVGPLRRVLPRDAIVVADITRLAYILLAEFPVFTPRSFLHPAGFVAMGYGLPAALGAKAAFPERTVVAIEGDGCFQMCGMELASMVQEKLPVIVVLVNDRCLSLIQATQERKYDRRFIGVDLVNPDFQQLAQAFGVRSWRVDTDPAFEAALQQAVISGEGALIEVKL